MFNVYHMIRHFQDKDRWSYEDGKHTCKVLFHGTDYVVTPGDPKIWHKEVEAFLKKRAYTSELNIDWWYSHVAKRHRGITRGIVFKLDDWLYEKIF